MVNAIPDTLPAIYRRCQKSLDAEKMPSVMLHTAHSPHERVPAPPPPHPYRCQPLDRLILYPPPPTSICTTKSPQWWRNKSTWRLCHGPYFALLLRLLPHFPPIVQVSRFVSGKKRNDTAHSHHQRRCKKWIISNFLHFLGIPLSGQTRTTVIVWPNQQFWEKVKIVLASTISSFGFILRHICVYLSWNDLMFYVFFWSNRLLSVAYWWFPSS